MTSYFIVFSDPNFQWLSSKFTEGEFKSFGSTKTNKNQQHQNQQTCSASQASVDTDQPVNPSVFSCPHEGCIKVFQRISSLERHLSLEKCTKSLEKYSLLDLAKVGYQSRLEGGVGVIPTIQAEMVESSSQHIANKGWALRAAKKYYRFNDKQKKYLDAKFEIGRATGRKMDGELVAKQMRRAQGPDGQRLFVVSEFLSSKQISSYFSRRAAKDRQGAPTVDDNDVDAYEEETNFSTARAAALQTLQLEHPITYDQYNVCSMVANSTLKNLKLVLLQDMCKGLELNVPKKDVRKKELYKNLLTEVVEKCSCQA